MNETNQMVAAPVSLCLSGGGFRALFFHLGVIRFMRDAGLLPLVGEIFSVSGGSILAAHLVRHWADYCDLASDEPFHRRSKELIDFAQRDIRGRILRRFLLFGWMLPSFRRSQQLVAAYDRLFAHGELRHLQPGPRLSILATSLTTGDSCSFARDGYRMLRNPLLFRPASHLRIGLAVAASSAFPPLFPPVELNRDMLNASEEEFPFDHDRLSDGGVFDNVGVHAFRLEHAATQAGRSLLIVSDASALFDWRLAGRFRFVVARADRWTNIMMRRIAQLEQTLGTTVPTVRLAIDDVISPTDASDADIQLDPQDEAVQRMAKNVRTDLDYFSFEEIRALVGHGFEVAWSRLLQLGFKTALQSPLEGGHAFRPWDPVPPGWPNYNEIVAARKLMTVGSVLETARAATENLLRTISVAQGKTPPPRSTASVQPLYSIDEVRRAMKRARKRHLRLWDARDWTSWLLLLATIVISTTLWLLGRFVWQAILRAV